MDNLEKLKTLLKQMDRMVDYLDLVSDLIASAIESNNTAILVNDNVLAYNNLVSIKSDVDRQMKKIKDVIIPSLKAEIARSGGSE